MSALTVFLITAIVLAITPGPGIAYVVARTVSGGRKEGLASCLGTGVGGMLHVLAAALGEWHGGPLPDLPEVSAAAESRRFIPRAAASLDRFLRRRGAEIQAQNKER